MRRSDRQSRERRLTDLDETRRLLYMAILTGPEKMPGPCGTRYYVLAGTLVNSLAHHSSLARDWRTTADNLVAYFRGEQDDSWLRAQLADVETELNRFKEGLL